VLSKRRQSVVPINVQVKLSCGLIRANLEASTLCRARAQTEHTSSPGEFHDPL
jgi:hypothetical protein